MQDTITVWAHRGIRMMAATTTVMKSCPIRCRNGKPHTGHLDEERTKPRMVGKFTGRSYRGEIKHDTTTMNSKPTTTMKVTRAQDRLRWHAGFPVVFSSHPVTELVESSQRLLMDRHSIAALLALRQGVASSSKHPAQTNVTFKHRGEIAKQSSANASFNACRKLPATLPRDVSQARTLPLSDRETARLRTAVSSSTS
ncbi:hypothetical protein Fuma_02517 [Fuerstiella marisgermanici]|uniref:Uncharacterized protein n=1 Tax=Fuerstiella marisgermanici TaxID=1891926 RepID=A0A1P8WFR7_9PLAN|nr:hypothetical protein Fuma_02517 [Fuerstiella marisgermanici]